jgi:hypothetical protein
MWPPEHDAVNIPMIALAEMAREAGSDEGEGYASEVLTAVKDLRTQLDAAQAPRVCPKCGTDV